MFGNEGEGFLHACISSLFIFATFPTVLLSVFSAALQLVMFAVHIGVWHRHFGGGGGRQPIAQL